MKKILLLVVGVVGAVSNLKAMEKLAVRNDGLIAMARVRTLPIAEQPVYQPMFLYELDHQFFRDRDIPNYDNFKEIIRECDAEAKRNQDPFIPLVVYVENAPALVGIRFVEDGRIHPSIERGLVRYSEENPFERSLVVNCEMRAVDGGARRLLSCDDDKELDRVLSDIKKLDSHFKVPFKSFGCDVEQITFVDILGQFDEQLTEIIEYKNSWNKEPDVAAVFEDALICVRDHLTEARVKINELQCASKKVVDYTRQLFDAKDDTGRILLRDKIKRVSTELFDLYLLHSVLELRNKAVRKIAIVAGGWHTGTIGPRLARVYGYFRSSWASVRATTPEDMKIKFEKLRPSYKELQVPDLGRVQ